MICIRSKNLQYEKDLSKTWIKRYTRKLAFLVYAYVSFGTYFYALQKRSDHFLQSYSKLTTSICSITSWKFQLVILSLIYASYERFLATNECYKMYVKYLLNLQSCLLCIFWSWCVKWQLKVKNINLVMFPTSKWPYTCP